MPKKRVSLRLNDNEVAVVGPLETWTHLIFIYESFAETYPEEAEGWNVAADWIREWVNKANLEEDDGWS